jgi:hypothetical protein
VKKALLLWLMTLLSGATSSATEEDVRLTADVDAREVGVEDQLQLTISVTGRSSVGGEVRFPPLKNLRVVGEPMESKQDSWVNGVYSQGRSYIYVLQATSPGKAEIGPARLRLASGTEKRTEPIAITVVSGSVRPRQHAGVGPLSQNPFSSWDPFGDVPLEPPFGRRRARALAPKITAVVTASRQTLHVGESLRLAYQVYTQTDLTGADFAEKPTVPGFWDEDLGQAAVAARPGEVATLDGERYVRFTRAEKLLFPMKPGRLMIPAARFVIGVAPFGEVVERVTKPITIEVTPIPTTPDLSGAVGQFKASASLDRTSISLGEAATLRFSIAGHGNLRWIERGPQVELPSVKVFPPQVRDAIKVDASGMSGSRTWERTQTARLTLDVTALASAVTAQAGPPSAVRPPATGGIALRAESEPNGARVLSLGTRGLLVFVSCVLLGHIGLWMAGRRPFARRALGAHAGRRTSTRSALADVARARVKGMSKEQSALLLEKALTETFGALESADNAAERAALEVLNEVRFLRYAPQLGDYSEKIREVAERAADVIRGGA